jgi:hypothetical protein
MRREDEFIGTLEGYLDEYEGVTPLPDAIRDAIRAEIPTTRQIRSIPPAMKYLSASMSLPAPARYGLVAAAVVVAAAVGAAFFARAGGTGGTSTPTPTPRAATTRGAATLIGPTGDSANPRGALAAGSYYVDRPFPVHLTFDVPQGTLVWMYTAAGSQFNLSNGNGGEVSFEIVDNISADPCTIQMLDPPVGPSVQDLVTALSNLPRFNATAATDVAIDGFRGKQFTLTAPDDNDARCDSMLTWKTTTRQNGVASGETNEVTILDVDGVRLLICIAYQPYTPRLAVSRMQAIVDSLQIDGLASDRSQ